MTPEIRPNGDRARTNGSTSRSLLGRHACQIRFYEIVGRRIADHFGGHRAIGFRRFVVGHGETRL